MGAIADRDESNPPGAAQPQIAEIEAEAKQAMGVLRQRRTAGDALRDDLAVRMDRRASFGLNPALSRLAIKNATHSIYVIPARGHVCVAFTDPVGAGLICPSTNDVAKGNSSPATAALETGGVAIFGVVPDGVDSVSVQTRASESIEVTTERNAYYTVVPSGTPLRTVSYVGPSGPVEFPISDPRLVMEQE
ncbi:MAG TPA: hypothetical protein VEW67_11940 [Thermoleophilaceae bacterium]|nr:hypothetical protein [Thermoleophilaceae bacterium]